MTIKRGIIVCLQSTGALVPTDVITRILSGSGVVHCGISLGDGRMINARGAGVCYSNVLEGIEVYAQLPDAIVEPTIAICQEQLGKPYDWAHLFANPIRNLFHVNIGCAVPNAFICSTLLAYAIRIAYQKTNTPQPNVPLFTKPIALVDPQDVLNAFPQRSFAEVCA